MPDSDDISEPNPPVVAAVDGSAVAYHAAAWAATTAIGYECRLQLVYSAGLPVGPGPDPILDQSDFERMRSGGAEVLAEAARIARSAVSGQLLEIDEEVTFTAVIPDLLERSHTSRMVVLGSRGLGALRRGLLGSVSTAISRHAHSPVAVVPATSATDAVSAGKPVLVGVDGTENSIPALELAFEQASRRAVGLVAVHAWSDATAGLDATLSGWDAIHDSEQAVLAESLAGWSERYPEVVVRRVLVRDRPAHALLERSEDAQLLVVGSHGRGGFGGMLLGSTSNALLHAVDDCPIVVVRNTAG